VGRNISKAFKPNALDSFYASELVKEPDRPRRIVYFSNICDQLSDYSYWYLLGTLWVDYSGWSDIKLWKKLFSSERPQRHESLMKPDEQREFHRLPDPLRGYRAHREGEKEWIAYTLDPHTAKVFSWKRGVPRFAEYLIPKASARALFTRRGEEEIIAIEESLAALIGWHEVPPKPEYLK
jgi:hypothetical protein